MPAGGPPDPWKTMADMWDAFNDAMSSPPIQIQRALDTWEPTRDSARNVGDAIAEEYPPE